MVKKKVKKKQKTNKNITYQEKQENCTNIFKCNINGLKICLALFFVQQITIKLNHTNF